MNCRHCNVPLDNVFLDLGFAPPSNAYLKKDDLNKLDHDSEVITFQVRTIAQARLIRKIGEISETQLKEIVKGLHEILTY